MEGTSIAILAYGQTGTGKTLTMTGLQNTFQDRGLAPRIIADLFKLKESVRDKYKVCIQISYIETVRSHVIDLINDKDEENRTSLANVATVKVRNIYGAMKILFKAEGRRQMMNESHEGNGLLTLHVMTQPLNVSNSEIRVAKIHLADLAGIDFYGNMTSFYKSLFALGGANTVKSQLEQFMLILCQNIPEQIKVKHRLNPVIQYLGNSLDGRSILRYIGHVRVDFENLMVTISVFRFGQIVRGLKPVKLENKVIEHKETKYEIIEEQLQQSKMEKDLEVMMANNDLASNLNQERIKHMQNVAKEYLQNKTNEVVLLNVTDAKTVLQVFKMLYAKLESERNEYMKAACDKIPETLAKSDSTPSTKSGRRGSKTFKSKDSLSGGGNRGSFTKGTKRPDKTSASPAPSLTKAERSKYDSPKQSVKRSRTSSLIRKNGSRRKSTASTTSIGTDVNEQVLQETYLPETLPEEEQAWSEFISDPEVRYDNLAKTSNLSEARAKDLRSVYLEEVKKLKILYDVVDLRKSELERVQMRQLLKREERNPDGTLVISETEQNCLETLNKAHQELVTQQEKLLKNQALYRIAIENYVNTKKSINEKFQQFCVQKYNTPLPPKELCKPTEVAPEESRVSGSLVDAKATEEALNYDKLKSIMKKQMERTLRQKDSKRKWIQSCKI